MFALPHIPSSSPHAAFLPTTPSPLSPRSANICSRRPAHMSSDAAAEKGAQNYAPPARFTTAPVRQVRKAPAPRQEELKEKRRGMFLRKVKEGREEKRFESRGEDIMRLEFVQRRRQWEAEQAREASRLDEEIIEEDHMEDEYELPTATHTMFAPQSQPDEEIDEVLQREEAELAELLAFMPEHDGPSEQQSAANRNDAQNLDQRAWDDPQDASQNAWSDDDGYDALFSEFADQSDHFMQPEEQRYNTAAHQAADAQLDEAMDLS